MLFQTGGNSFPAIRGHQIADMSADQLLTRDAVKSAGGIVHVQHVTFEVLDKDRVRRVFKQFAKSLLAFSNQLFNA